mmetsp:Transcript_15184/g.17725  ORF Transcript_15184/g.17725 Transcript_15184/m.17725 type:complete len:85 (+) Transcript_15184:651-905(+)
MTPTMMTLTMMMMMTLTMNKCKHRRLGLNPMLPCTSLNASRFCVLVSKEDLLVLCHILEFAVYDNLDDVRSFNYYFNFLEQLIG